MTECDTQAFTHQMRVFVQIFCKEKIVFICRIFTQNPNIHLQQKNGCLPQPQHEQQRLTSFFFICVSLYQVPNKMQIIKTTVYSEASPISRAS